jgi:hypothetical protein
MKKFFQLSGALPFGTLRVFCFVIALCAFAQLSFAGPGSALLITNSTAYVQTGPINPGAQTTIEAWIRTSATNRGEIITKLDPNTAAGFSLEVVLGRVVFGFGDTNSGVLTGARTVTDGQWHHVAGTYAFGAAAIYVDGALDTNVTRTAVTNMNSSFHTVIGNCEPCNHTNGLIGQIDEVRIWSTNRAQTDIQATMNEKLIGNESFLQAYWRFDEGTGTTVADSSGHGNTGNFFSTARWTNSTAPIDQPIAFTDSADTTNGVVTLRGRVNPRGVQSFAYFEWGTTTNYGNFTTITNAGSGTTTQNVAIVAGHMIPGFTNHFRLVATNTVLGRRVGADQTIVPPVPDTALTGLHFDGTNDYVAIPRSISNDFTIEFWFRSTQVAGTNLNWWQGMGLVDAEIAGNHTDFGTSLGNGQVLFGIGGSGGFGDRTIASGFVADGNWHHVAAERVRTNGLFSLYIDGAFVTSSNGSTLSLTDPTRITIGMLQSGVNFFNGDIDEVRLWNTARSSNEIQNYMRVRLQGNEPGLVGYYRLDEGGGGFAYDSSAHGNTGTLVTNGPTWFSSDAPVSIPVSVASLPAKIYRTHAYAEGYVVANVPATTVYFEWGLTTSYGNVTTPAVLDAGYNWNFEQELPTQSALTQFNYRIVASNALGVAIGTNQTVTTSRFYEVSSGFSWDDYSGIWAPGDYDNDGHLDFVTTAYDPVADGYFIVFMHGDGNGHFTAVTNRAMPTLRSFSTIEWIDYDNDGRLDLWLMGQVQIYTNFNTVRYDYVRLFHNLGNGQFAEESNFTPPQIDLYALWGDYDNDGLPDLYYGSTAPFYSPFQGNLLFHNEGHGHFTQVTSPFPDATGDGAWADLDNDGLLDFLTRQEIDYGVEQIVLYRNLGNGQFTNVNEAFPDYANRWQLAEMNNDGLLDVVTATSDTNFVLRNVGDGTFTAATMLPGFYNSLNAADYDNDGWRDLEIGQYSQFTLYRSLHNGAFAPETIDPAIDSSLAFWADLNGDGKVDVMMSDGSVFLNGAGTNTPPTAPGNLSAAISNGVIRFSWSSATDAQTPANALSYSVRVGTAPGSDDVWSSGALSNGTRLTYSIGNAQYRTNAFFRPRVGGTLYWSVQAIDSQYMGGPFSTNAAITVPIEIAPGSTGITQTLASGEFIALGLSVTNTTTNTVTLQNLFAPNLPPWLTLSTPQETLAPGASANIIFTLNATGLSNGVYQTTIVLSSSGNDIPETRIPLTLNVGPNGLVPGDLNHDGVVDLNELNTVIQYYRHVRP